MKWLIFRENHLVKYYSQEISRFAPFPWSPNSKCRCARSNIQGPDSVVATVNCYGRDFPHTSKPAPGPLSLLHTGERVYFPGVAGEWCWPPTSFYRGGREWVELYLYILSVPAYHVTTQLDLASWLKIRFRSLLQSFLTKYIIIHITRPLSLSSIVLSLDYPCCAHINIGKLFRLNMNTCPLSQGIRFSWSYRKQTSKFSLLTQIIYHTAALEFVAVIWHE